MQKPETIYRILEKHVPGDAIHYCFDLWESAPFELKISRSRNSKLGDYRYDFRDQSERISVNNNLNIYAFLITYLHEVAHLKAYHQHGRRINPHGKEWKSTFSNLLKPMASDLIFPEDVLIAVQKYMRSPKATSGGHHDLAKALNKYNLDGGSLLHDLEYHALFSLNKRTFRKGELRRTSFICEEIKSGKKYLISKNAVVKLA